MTDHNNKRATDMAFAEASAAADFNIRPTSQRTYPQGVPKTPWYFAPESGGRNPAIKKPGVEYDDPASGV